MRMAEWQHGAKTGAVDVAAEVETNSFEIARGSQALSGEDARQRLKPIYPWSAGGWKLCTESVSFPKYSQDFSLLRELRLGVISIHRKRDLPEGERQRGTTQGIGNETRKAIRATGKRGWKRESSCKGSNFGNDWGRAGASL